MLSKKSRILAAGAVALSLSAKSFAADFSIRLDKPAMAKDAAEPANPNSVVQAFPDDQHCHVWYYMAASQYVTGRPLHTLADVSVKSLPKKNQSENVPIALVSALSFESVPAVRPNLEALKADILVKLAQDPKCAPLKLTANDLSLTPILAKVVPAAELDRKDAFYFSQTIPTHGSSAKAYIDASNSVAVSHIMDASDPRTPERVAEIMEATKQAPATIGQLSYVLNGVTSELKASLIFEGEFNSKWESAVKNIGCEVKNKSGGLSVSGAAGSLSHGLGGSIGGGGVDVGYHEKSTTCNYKLLTNFMGGEYGVKARFEFGAFNWFSADDKPIQILDCDSEQNCIRKPLIAYVKEELWKMWLINNMNIYINKIQDETYRITLGRQGEVKSTVNATIDFKQKFAGKLVISVPVVAKNVDLSGFKASRFTDARTQCAIANYRKQRDLYGEFLNIYPIPVSPKCDEPVNQGTN